MDAKDIDSRIFDLYDTYCHSNMGRREFLNRASAIPVVGGVSALAMAQALLPTYSHASLVKFTDPRIKATYVNYDSPGGTTGQMRGYLVQPATEGPFSAVCVIHENRGLNPYIEDVARRAAVEGFLAFAPDGLFPIGGYPGNDDDGRVMQRSLDREKLYIDLLNGAKFVQSHPLSNGKLGATGFCFGGLVVNKFATDLGEDIAASVPFYGRAPETADVPKIKASMMVQYAEDDPRVNATRADYEAALKEHGIDHVMHTYPGTRHGFHNNSTPRYNEEQAKIAWDRTMAHFKAHLG